jgi:hypothetical protein
MYEGGKSPLVVHWGLLDALRASGQWNVKEEGPGRYCLLPLRETEQCKVTIST